MFNMNFSESDRGLNVRNNKNKNLLFNLQDYEELDDFTNVCRICANVTNQVSPIFGEQSQCDNLAGKINKYLPIEVSCEDGLPQVICEQCQNTLLAWDELVTCCIQATVLLQQKLSALRQPDPDKTKEERTESTGSPIQTGTETWCNFNDVREVMTNYLKELNIEEKNSDLEYVCQICTDSPASKSIEELTEHLKALHGCKLQKKQSIEEFVRNNIMFEEVLITDKDYDADNDTDTLTDTKETKLENYCCPFCKSVFSSPSRLLYHLNKHMEISAANTIMCCDQSYENKLAFVVHLQDEHVNRVLNENSCKSCGLTTSNFEDLQTHIKDEHSESNDLNWRKEILHIAGHQKYIPVVCPQCNKTFSNKYNLRVHLHSHHISKPLTFTCEKCNKTYKSQGSLKHHNKICHEGILRYLCSFCGEAFPTRGSRNVHSRIHTGAKPFQCYQCGKSYRAKNTLNRHMDMHLDIRNYACQLCPKKFRKRTHLNYHLSTHGRK